MGRIVTRGGAARAAWAALAWGTLATVAPAQGPAVPPPPAEQEELLRSAKEASAAARRLYQAGRLAEAAPLMERVVAAERRRCSWRKAPLGSHELASALNNLSLLYGDLDDYGRARD